MKHYYIQFNVGDWLKDSAVGSCAPSTRGIWLDLLCAMHEGGRTGELVRTRDQLARLARCTVPELNAALDELRTSGAALVAECHGVVTVTNRRMKREADDRKQANSRKTKSRTKAERAAVTAKSRDCHADSHAAVTDIDRDIDRDRDTKGASAPLTKSNSPTLPDAPRDPADGRASKDSILTPEALTDLHALRAWYDHERTRPDSKVDGSQYFWTNTQAAAAKASTAEGIADRVALFKFLVFRRKWDYLHAADDELAGRLRLSLNRNERNASAAFLEQLSTIGNMPKE